MPGSSGEIQHRAFDFGNLAKPSSPMSSDACVFSHSLYGPTVGLTVVPLMMARQAEEKTPAGADIEQQRADRQARWKR